VFAKRGSRERFGKQIGRIGEARDVFGVNRARGDDFINKAKFNRIMLGALGDHKYDHWRDLKKVDSHHE
jgi:hypothetical protein